jgi:hypothetical protein
MGGGVHVPADASMGGIDGRQKKITTINSRTIRNYRVVNYTCFAHRYMFFLSGYYLTSGSRPSMSLKGVIQLLYIWKPCRTTMLS